MGCTPARECRRLRAPGASAKLSPVAMGCRRPRQPLPRALCNQKQAAVTGLEGSTVEGTKGGSHLPTLALEQPMQLRYAVDGVRDFGDLTFIASHQCA